MAQIQCLSPHVADLIAAGEVVERPASVVKELLENAIDAGAAAVVAEMEHGGLTYLRITDNGCGIAPEQLPTAFLRHATSKLRTESDLAAIGTLGFRGEALAAISAVSHVDIFSRETGAAMGAALHLDGGVPAEVTETGCPEGTTICVRDLFYNTPARMKFMKKDTAEASAITGIVQHLSLSHPDVSFKLIKDGAEVLHTPGDGQLLSAVYAALGRDFALGLVPVRGCGGDVTVEGFVTKPLSGHGTRGRQIFFVNGRFVKSQLLSAALEEAYRNQIMKGKFPGCVLHVTLPKNAVDVNVHPAKTVVKFVSDKTVFDAVYYTVLDTLSVKPAGQKAEISRSAVPRAAAFGVPAPEQSAPPERKENFYQTMTAEEYRTKNPAPAPSPAPAPLGSFVSRVPPAASEWGRKLTVNDGGSRPAAAPVSARTAAQTAGTAEEKSAQKAAEMPAPPVQAQEMPGQQTFAAAAPWRIAGEVLRTYIICEAEGGTVYLVDKHAAHERLRFDALKAHPAPVMPQVLLTPLTVELDQDAYTALLEQLPLLREFGFACEDFGGGTLLVREIPDYVDAADVPAALEELSEQFLSGGGKAESARDALLHTMACKSAIRAGMHSDPKELAALVEKVQSGQIQYCPHGRPVKVKITRHQLEKLFKRA